MSDTPTDQINPTDNKPKERKENDGKYRPQYCQEVIEFFVNERAQFKYPTFSGYAGHVRHVGENTITNWRKDHPEFNIACEECEAIAKDDLINGAMAERYNASFSKFVASNCHGMRDQSALALSNPDGSLRQQPIINCSSPETAEFLRRAFNGKTPGGDADGKKTDTSTSDTF
jgi:hypothetical protein